ncbi:MAG: crossover junction endodeoxyribonuclease RuvC [Ignavibacteriales bacterium]
MIILGVDPGTIVTGFGIVKLHKNELTYVVQGAIKPPVSKSLPCKLEIIYNELDKYIKIYKPDEFAIESAFFGKNVQSAMKIGYARGVAMLAAVHNGLPVSEYSPREVKKSVTGNGAATKKQVQYMINHILNLDEKKMLFDESDALAVAACHAFRIKTAIPRSKNWKAFIEQNPDRIVNN